MKHLILLVVWMSAMPSMAVMPIDLSYFIGSKSLPNPEAAGNSGKKGASKPSKGKSSNPSKQAPKKKQVQNKAGGGKGRVHRGRNNRGGRVKAKIIVSKHTGVKKTMSEATNQRLIDMHAASMTPEERAAFEKERQTLVTEQFAKDLADQTKFRERIKSLRLSRETVNAPLEDGESPLHIAVKHRWHLAAEDLLKKGADPTVKNLGGNSAIDIAHMLGDAQMIQLLSQSLAATP